MHLTKAIALTSNSPCRDLSARVLCTVLCAAPVTTAIASMYMGIARAARLELSAKIGARREVLLALYASSRENVFNTKIKSSWYRSQGWTAGGLYLFYASTATHRTTE